MKKILKTILALTAFAAMLSAAPFRGVGNTWALPDDDEDETIVDTLDSRPVYPIFLLSRAYGDKVVLRWAFDKYALWQLAKTFGIDIVRYDLTDIMAEPDTLCRDLRPMTLEQMEQRFEATDSLAGVAAMALHGRGMSEGKNFVDVYDDQQTRYAYALLVAEWRPDLADAMAMRFEDRTARPGGRYQYAVVPNIPDSIVHTRSGQATVENVPYVAPRFNPVIGDSIYPNGMLIRLNWDRNDHYSGYDVRRRFNGGEWKQLNGAPIITYSSNETDPTRNYYSDIDVDTLGTFDYQVRGYDSFGEKSEWSAVHTVKVGDNTPPAPPRISLFEVTRKGENKEQAFVTVHWEKVSMEDDMAGYNVYYYHESQGHIWRKLNTELIAKTDTTFYTEVTALSSGFVIVASVDKSGNEGPSVPQEIDMEDFTPPAMPTGLRHTLLPNGVTILRWDANKEIDLKGYQLYVANDTTHTFQPQPGGLTPDTIAYDTMAVRDVNQRYIYYRLRAYDYAGNGSPMTPIYRVQRISFDKPEQCIIDTLWQDSTTLYMDWQCQDAHTTKEYRLYRRMEGTVEWHLVQVVDAEAVDNFVVHTQDSPEPDRTHKYFYCLEAVGISGVVGDKSYPVSFLLTGPMLIEVKLTLTGEVNKRHAAALDWAFEGSVPIGYYYEMEYQDKDGNWYPLSTMSGEQTHSERNLVRPGDSRTYRVLMRWKDGLISTPSNPVTVTNNYKYEDETTDEEK